LEFKSSDVEIIEQPQPTGITITIVNHKLFSAPCM